MVNLSVDFKALSLMVSMKRFLNETDGSISNSNSVSIARLCDISHKSSQLTVFEGTHLSSLQQDIILS